MDDRDSYYSSPENERARYNRDMKASNQGSYYDEDRKSYYSQSQYKYGYRTRYDDSNIEIDTDNPEQVNFEKSRFASTALILSILGLVFASCFGVGIVLEIIALNKRKVFRQLNNNQDNGATKAVLVLSIFGIIGGVIGLIGTIISFLLPVIFSIMEMNMN